MKNKIRPSRFLTLISNKLLLFCFCTNPLNLIDDAVNRAIERKQTPGAVVLVGHKGRIIYHKAFGIKIAEPEPVAMTLDTIFDIASLTKPMVTALLAVKIIEMGRLQLSDPIAKYLPEFNVPDKKEITLEQILTHRAGFSADLACAPCGEGKDACVKFIAQRPLIFAPGTQYLYACQGFFVLGVVVEKIMGKLLDVLAQEYIFVPLRMADTSFCPGPVFKDRIAPTEKVDGVLLHGVVHDPAVRALGGVAGNAGVFSTAADLAIFCQMMLNGGIYNGVRILDEATVKQMTSFREVQEGTACVKCPFNQARGLGWDINTKQSFARGDLFPVGTSYGHTGFTGVSLWLDPASQTFVIFLSNRLYPDGKGDVKEVRSKIATIVAELQMNKEIDFHS